MAKATTARGRARCKNAGHRPDKLENIQQPTSNTEHPIQRARQNIGCWALIVRCWMFLKLLRRILPDPVALRSVFIARLVLAHDSSVIRFIPADGVEQEFPVLRAAIMQ